MHTLSRMDGPSKLTFFNHLFTYTVDFLAQLVGKMTVLDSNPVEAKFDLKHLSSIINTLK